MGLEDRIKIAPSILAADFSRLGEQVAEAAEGGADYIHVDIMDGHFVPNLTIGPQMVRALRRWTEVPLDVHMMVSEPGNFIAELADSGADIITVHSEASVHLHRLVHQIKESGVRAGVAISPATPLLAVGEVLQDLDLVLVMTVNPGFGGQPFMESMVDKIATMRSILDDRGLPAELEVDGGIDTRTAQAVLNAGARVLVAGSAVYNTDTTVAEAISSLRNCVATRAKRSHGVKKQARADQAP